MNTMKKIFLNILVLFVIAAFCGCQSQESKILAAAEKNLENGLESDLPAKYVIPQSRTTKNSNRNLRIIIYRVLFRISMLLLMRGRILVAKQ